MASTVDLEGLDLRSIVQMVFIIVGVMLAFVIGKWTAVEEIKLASRVICENPYVNISGSVITIENPTTALFNISPQIR